MNETMTEKEADAKKIIDTAKDVAENLLNKTSFASRQTELSFNSLHEKLDILNVSSAVIEEKINGTNRRLDTLNGKVAEHEREIALYQEKIRNFPIIQKLVFGAAALILVGFFSALVALIITKQ